MIRSNDYVEIMANSLKELFKQFKNIAITTENKNIDKLLERNKAVILLNHIPMNKFKRVLDDTVETLKLNTGCFVIGNSEDRKYLVDIIDKMTQELYEGCEFDRETNNEYINYIGYDYGYESVPDVHNVMYFSGTLKTQIDFKEV